MAGPDTTWGHGVYEIFDHDLLDPTPAMLERDPRARPLDVNGKRGQILGWEEDEGKFVFETFDNEVLSIGEANLREHTPPPLDQGGFHLAYPKTEDFMQSFPSEMARQMVEQNYCVVQMSSSPPDRQSAKRTADLMDDKWTRMIPEFEALYMGRSPHGKKIMWTEAPKEGFELDNGLAVADRLLSDVAFALLSVSQEFGFEAFSRTNSMVHTNCANRDDEEDLLDLLEGDSKVVAAKAIQDHLLFSYRRKICLIFFMYGSGGVLTLHPLGRGAGSDDIVISCTENQLVAFRHDLCDYTFQPSGSQMALQAWILREPMEGETDIAPEVDVSILEDYEAMPKQPHYGDSIETCDCMSLGTRLPGDVNTPEGYWSLLGTGTDGVIMVPVARWDIDMYYTDDTSGNTPGKAYVRHFGFLTSDQMMLFDNEFFGISQDEAENFCPAGRNILECGYDTLYRAGWTKHSLEGSKIATCYGYGGSEFCNHRYGGLLGYNEEIYRRISNAAVASRIQYIFGVKGHCTTIETACSSSLYATAIIHSMMRPQMIGQQLSCREQHKHGMCAGSNGHFDPGYTIGLAAAHMLSLTGRCYTFDSSGDGFIRGEACACMYYKVSDGENLAALAGLAGTCMNQDGRSASLTAPNGPSQQECIRRSLREAGIAPLDIQIQELHGTGTALGDPIEVGALRATMMTHDGETREHPLVKTSSKSNLGHTELTAGICGIMKCVLMGLMCVSAPNVHLRLLNPHIDVHEYPVYFTGEFVDQGKNVGFHGVSSFGFSGCNARGDIWGRALGGPRNCFPGKMKVDLTLRRVLMCAKIFGKVCMPDTEKPPVDDGVEALDMYQADYETGTLPKSDLEYFCAGTFNGWSLAEPMEWFEDLNAYGHCFFVDDVHVEQFRILANRKESLTIFPATKAADQEAIVLGPGVAPPFHNWMISVPKDAVPGSLYIVIFWWDEADRKKKVMWGPTDDPRAREIATRNRVSHTYHVLGTWNCRKPLRMQPGPAPGSYMARLRIGLEGYEEFQLQRDADPLQAIYPSRARTTAAGPPVCGPDHRSDGKWWRIVGETGERVTIELQMADGEILVRLIRANETVTWTSHNGAARRRYSITASWNDWGSTPMVPDPDGDPSVHRLRVVMTRAKLEAFQIVVDEDPAQTIHPEMQLTDQLMSQAMGPDGKGENLNWGLYARPGNVVEFKLDLSQADRRKVVTWTVQEG